MAWPPWKYPLLQDLQENLQYGTFGFQIRPNIAPEAPKEGISAKIGPHTGMIMVLNAWRRLPAKPETK